LEREGDNPNQYITARLRLYLGEGGGITPTSILQLDSIID